LSHSPPPATPSAHHAPVPSLVRRNLRLLTWFNFLEDFRLYAPVMVIYFETITGSYALAMSVLSLIMLSSALLEVPTGVFSDRVGRRKTMVAGAVASLLSVVMYAIGGTYEVLLVGALFEGLARSLYSGTSDALLHDTLTELDAKEDFALQLGRTSSAFQFALGISALLGGVLADIAFALVMWLSVLPKVIQVAVSWRFIEPSIHKEESGNSFAHLRDALRLIVRNPRLRMLTIGRVIVFSVGEALFMFRTVFIETLWALWAVGLARTIANFGAAFSFYFAGALQKRFGERRLLYVGIAGSETVNMIALIIANVVSPLMMGLTSLFFGVNNVSMGAMMQREFSDAQRATMGSLVAFGGSLIYAIIAPALGALADAIGVRDALLITTLFAYTPLIFFHLAFRPRSEVSPHDD
jgi:MFS family permease